MQNPVEIDGVVCEGNGLCTWMRNQEREWVGKCARSMWRARQGVVGRTVMAGRNKSGDGIDCREAQASP